MFNKIIKRGHKKASKSDGHELSALWHGSSNVIGTLASRALVANEPANTTLQMVKVGKSSQVSGVIEVLPLLKDVSVADRPHLFYRKMHICCFLFDFSDSLKSPREKEIKRQILTELVELIQSGSCKMTEVMQEQLIRMVYVNIFRCLPPAFHESTGSENIDPEEEEPYMEPSWPQLQIVYEILLRYVVSSETDTKVAKRYIDHFFVLKLVDLFDSEDPREREYLKTILHRIYGKFMIHRPIIRKGISNVFYRFIFETEKHSGICELLEILGSIINGFALPMKEEHRLFLVRALIPLHKPKCISYHQQLSYCITQFVEKDYKLADTVIRGILKYWPLTNCQKEVLFLGELEEVLVATQATEFQQCMVPLFRQLGRCLSSPHFQVAERTLFLWNEEHIVGLIAQNRNVIVPILIEALENNVQSHWNQAVHGLTANVRRMFVEMDAELYEECQGRYQEKEARAGEFKEQRESTWRRLEAAAALAGGEDMVVVN